MNCSGYKVTFIPLWPTVDFLLLLHMTTACGSVMRMSAIGNPAKEHAHLSNLVKSRTQYRKTKPVSTVSREPGNSKGKPHKMDHFSLHLFTYALYNSTATVMT